jgi:hypothetical protein
VWKQIAHDVDDGFHATGALFSVFNGHGVFHHLLDVSTVFG